MKEAIKHRQQTAIHPVIKTRVQLYYYNGYDS